MISMNKIKTYFRKINYRIRHGISIENIVLILAIFLCLFCTYQSIIAMSRNWELSEKLTRERKNLELIAIEIEAAELENEYYKTEEYQELMARRNLDKKLMDENMVVMPENSEAAKNKYKIAASESREKNYSNMEKWVRFLFPSY